MARTTRSLTAQLVRHGELLPLVAIAVVAMMMACADEIAAPTPPAMMVAARRAPPATSRVLAAYEALRAESVFAAPRVGYAGQLSPQSRHFHVLLADRHAADLFGRLWSEATTPAGQLYALAGLYLVDRPSFEQLSPILAHSRATVPMFVGCIYSETPVPTVLESLTKDGLARDFLPDRATAREERFLDSLEASRRGH